MTSTIRINESLRTALKHQLLEEVYDLSAEGAFWVTPDGEKLPFVAIGKILCPLALALYGRQEPATQMHERFANPFGGSKYDTPEGPAERYAQYKAYYQRANVVLLSATCNVNDADTKEGRTLIAWYCAFKYGSDEVRQAKDDLDELVRAKYARESLPEIPAVKSKQGE